MNSVQRSVLSIIVLVVLLSLGALALRGSVAGGVPAAPVVAVGATQTGPLAPSSAQAVAQASPAGLWAKPPIGNSWEEYFGVNLEAALNASGPRVLNPKPGQVYFYTNSGTGWGATNTKNSVVIFDVTDMKNWKHVATTNLPDEYALGYSSHGASVSADGRWIYLQAMANPEKPPRLVIIDGFTLKPYKIYRSTLGGNGGHHVNNFTGPDGREYIMNVDFGWNFGGAGGWVIDPEKDNAIVGGMHRFDLSGHPYVFTGDIQGKWMYATVPAPTSSLRGKMEGYLAKIDMQRWRVVGAVPILDPIWAEVTQDGKIAWVTEGDGQKVKKVDLEKMEVIAEVSTGPGPWGARLSCDESKLYVADKGESSGYAQQGRTMTIIDTRFNIVTNVVPIGRTTDHVILSPDCKYVIANSNADHGLWIYDAETEKLVATVKIPNDGDPHGGTFVRWLSDGKGGVVGEVISTLTGLRGSTRKAQLELIKATREAITIQLTRYDASRGIPAAPVPDTVRLKPGAAASLIFTYPVGTSASMLTVEGRPLGIARFEIRPGERRLVRFTVPAQQGKYEVTLGGVPKTIPLTVLVEAQAAAPGPQAAAPAPAGIREVRVVAIGLKWEMKTLTLKAGERVRFTIVNQDDEKHNLVSPDLGLLPPVSPDVNGGQTTSFEWTVPNRPGTYRWLCIYHPAMVIEVTVE